jgi:predicted RNase H-like HicB family nuclease
MTKYEIIIYWSEDDEAFVAEVPELPGCMAHGSTQEEALSQIQEAMDLWLETARKTGREVPEPKGRRLILA